MPHPRSHRHPWNSAAFAVRAALVVLALFDGAAMAGTIYKCASADGTVAFRDQPCDASASQSEVSVHNPTQFDNAQPSVQAQSAPEAFGAEPKDCSTRIPPPWKVEVEPPPEPDLSAYPQDEAGQPILAAGQNVQLVAVTRDRRDAMSVQSECTGMVDGCFHNGNDKRNSYDACFNSAPRCASSRPWEESKPCCPESCWQQYADLRRQCVDPFSASTRVFFKDHCVPGVAELLGGSKPP